MIRRMSDASFMTPIDLLTFEVKSLELENRMLRKELKHERGIKDGLGDELNSMRSVATHYSTRYNRLLRTSLDHEVEMESSQSKLKEKDREIKRLNAIINGMQNVALEITKPNDLMKKAFQEDLATRKVIDLGKTSIINQLIENANGNNKVKLLKDLLERSDKHFKNIEKTMTSYENSQMHVHHQMKATIHFFLDLRNRKDIDKAVLTLKSIKSSNLGSFISNYAKKFSFDTPEEEIDGDVDDDVFKKQLFKCDRGDGFKYIN